VAKKLDKAGEYASLKDRGDSLVASVRKVAHSPANIDQNIFKIILN
jgi:hypothetical protein